jgi:hypothetical protein
MNKKLASTIAIALSALSLTAHAQELRLGQPAYGGTGCPSGSASVTVSPDQSALSILFDSYVTESGASTGRAVDRKSCNISIPVTVPSGYSVAVFQVDYRGYNLVPRGGMAKFDAEYFWAGARGPRVSRTYTGPTNENFSISDGLVATTMVWSPCGADVILRTNTSLMSKSNARGEQAMSMVDSADITSGLVYRLQYRRCR